MPKMPLLDSETVESALTQWACGQASQAKLAQKYGVSPQLMQIHLQKAARAHLNAITPEMWRFHKEFGTPFPIRIPAAEAFTDNAAFHYGQWLIDQFKKQDMRVTVKPFLDPETKDVVFGLVDVDFWAAMEKGKETA